MTTLREAAQMALDALDSDNPDIQLRAATHLRAALAQPEQEPVAFLADATRFKVTLTQNDCKITNLPRELGGRWVALVAAENDCHMKLTAPPQREWVGLTDEEIDLIAGRDRSIRDQRIIREAEAKLREKNQ